MTRWTGASNGPTDPEWQWRDSTGKEEGVQWLGSYKMKGTLVGVPGGRQWAWGLWVTLIVLGCFQVSNKVGGRWFRSG